MKYSAANFSPPLLDEQSPRFRVAPPPGGDQLMHRLRGPLSPSAPLLPLLKTITDEVSTQRKSGMPNRLKDIRPGTPPGLWVFSYPERWAEKSQTHNTHTHMHGRDFIKIQSKHKCTVTSAAENGACMIDGCCLAKTARLCS